MTTLTDNQPAMASETIYHNDTYGVTVFCTDARDPMKTMVFEDGDYGVDVAMSYIFEWLQWYCDYDPKTQRANIYNAYAILNHTTQKPESGVDYTIVDIDKPRRNDTLMCKKAQLTRGDVILSWRKRQTGDIDRDASVTTVTGNETWLSWDMEQGYYRFNIIDGPKWQAFQRDPESVAVWVAAANCWHWKDQ